MQAKICKRSMKVKDQILLIHEQVINIKLQK